MTISPVRRPGIVADLNPSIPQNLHSIEGPESHPHYALIEVETNGDHLRADFSDASAASSSAGSF